MIRRLPLLLMILFVCQTGWAGKKKETMYKYSLDFTFSKTNFVDTIPLRVVKGQLLVPVTMNGEKLFFKLDTGSGQGMIYQGGRIQPKARLGKVNSTDGNNHQQQIDVVSLPSFTLGSLRVDNYVASVAPGSVLGQHYDHAAIIGFDLFEKGLTGKIDVQNKRLIISDRKAFFEREGGYALGYKLRGHVPCVKVEPVAGLADEVVFDSGLSGFYRMGKERFDRCVRKSKLLAGQVEERVRGSISISNHSVENEDEIAFLKLRELRWAGYAFCHVDARTHQGASTIGRDILRYGALVVNPFRKQLVFQPYAAGTSTDVQVEDDSADIFYVPRDGKPTVGLVRQHSDMYKAGFRKGDVILSINGHATPDFSAFLRQGFVKGRKNTLVLRDVRGFKKEVSFFNN